MEKVLTKGGINVPDIKVGDIHYEYGYGHCIESKVLTLPQRDEEGFWSWKSQDVNSGIVIDYGMREGYTHYSPNLYNYKAYTITQE